MKDQIGKGDVTKSWEKWAKRNAVKFITDGHSEKLPDFLASGIVTAGAAVGALRAALGDWSFLNGILLDYGCGLGRHTKWFDQVFIGAIGVDASLEMLRQAQVAVPGVGFLVSGETTVPLSSGLVDIVFAFTVLQHNPRSNVKALVAEFARVLKPGGIICIQLPVVSELSKVAYPKDARHTAVWGVEEFEAAFLPSFQVRRLAIDNHFGFHILEKW